MSTIRFVHTDHFRLGTALSGLSDSPGWLQQLATDCVRQSVRNVIETAVARQAQFLLIAGSVTESREDLEPAVRWLDDQFETLRSRGIRIVATANDADTNTGLNRICDIVLSPGQSLIASLTGQSNVHLNACSTGQAGSGDLAVTIGEHVPKPASRMVYHAVPSIRPSRERHDMSHSGTMTRSAGAVQAVSPTETWEGGCLLVEADTTSQTIESNAHTCDVIRFATERVSLANVAAGKDLVPTVIQESDSLGARTSRTTIVDWVLNTNIAASAAEVKTLDSRALLADLRDRMHGGHHGVWPRLVSFSSESALQLFADDRAALEEYIDVANGPVSSFDGTGVNSHQVCLQGGIGISADLVAGLSLLHRAA